MRVMVCTRLPDSTLLKKILVASEVPRGARLHPPLQSMPHNFRVCSFPLAWHGECISPTATFNELVFKTAVRSSRHCILVAGLLDAFVTVYNLQRTNRGPGLNFRELMYGRIKMMTALCPAWAHTYQTMCFRFHPEQLRPDAFQLPMPKNNCHATYLPDYYQIDWHLVSRLETLHGWWLKRNIDGTEMAGWESRLFRDCMAGREWLRHDLWVPRLEHCAAQGS